MFKKLAFLFSSEEKIKLASIFIFIVIGAGLEVASIAGLAVFVGLFLGKNLAKLKLGRKYAALKERNYLLDRSLNDANDELKNTQLEKEALIASKTRLATELKNSDEKIAKNKEELNAIQE